jgi:hypothetical protein
MRFYTQQHKYYCGVDLRAWSIYVCILNQEGAVFVYKNLQAIPDTFLAVIALPGRSGGRRGVHIRHTPKAVLAEIRKRMELDRKIAV